MKSKEELSKKIHGVIVMNQNLVKFSTAENIGISEFHLISWSGKFVERQFPQSYGQFARNSAQTVLFYKI